MEIQEKRQIEIFKKMSPSKKIEVAMRLYASAKELKRAGIKMLHPNWSEKEVEQELYKVFLYARS